MVTKIPGPRGLPVVGHLPWLVRDSLGFLQKLSREHGDIAAFRVGMTPAVFITAPKLIDRIIKDRSFERSHGTRRALASFLKYGLLSLEGQPHMRHRRLMQPAFHRERIKRYGEIMASETYAVLGQWQSQQPRDLRADMMRLTFAIVTRALFNSETKAEAERVDRALQQIQPAVMRMGQLARVLPFEVPMLYSAKTQRAIQSLHQVVVALVQQRRRENDDRGDLLSMLLTARDEDGSALSDEDICAEILTMLFAGHETTANTMTWAWHLLTQHPKQQEALAAEVRALVGERQLSFDDLPQLTLADRMVRETMRLYPAAWWADRISTEAVELGGYTVPANTLVVFSVYVTQRDPRYFAAPDTFDPDRFSPERVGQIPDGAYLPFGAGVHMCIGNTFALMEARLILSAMAQRFKLGVSPGANERVRPLPLVTLGMAEPYPVVPVARAAAEVSSRPRVHDG